MVWVNLSTKVFRREGDRYYGNRAAILGRGIALVAHGGKTAARTAVTPSPEPLSNTVLSAGSAPIRVDLERRL